MTSTHPPHQPCGCHPNPAFSCHTSQAKLHIFPHFPPMLSLLPVLLAALTFLSWPSGPRPWLGLLTTSPTELQIGWHTMPQILIQRHKAPTSRTPCTLFNSTSLLSILSFISTTFPLSSTVRVHPNSAILATQWAQTSPTLLE